MMMATGLGAAGRFKPYSKIAIFAGTARRPRNDGADYRNSRCGRKLNRTGARHPRSARSPQEGARFSCDDGGGLLVLDESDPIAQHQLALFQALDLENIRPGNRVKRIDRRIKVALILPQPLELRPQLDFLVLGHSTPPN